MKKEIQDALSCLLSMALENDKYESQKEQYKIVNDYITNLQEENKELNDDNIWWNNRFKAVERDKRKLKDRINKAIEYIEEYQDVLKEHNGDWLNYQDGFKPYLLVILRGSDKE